MDVNKDVGSASLKSLVAMSAAAFIVLGALAVSGIFYMDMSSKKADRMKSYGELSKEGKIDVEVLAANEAKKTASDVRSLAIKVFAATTLIIVLASVAMISLVEKKMLEPLDKLKRAVNNSDHGMAFQIPAGSEGETGRLAISIKGQMEGFHNVFQRFLDASNAITASVSDISSAISMQATVSSEQAAAVAEITSTSEELSASASQIAEHAKSVVDIASKTWEDTKKGATAIETVIMKMNDIYTDNQTNIGEIIELGKKSKEISKIMEIINTIADQTKLIAFNAALEASSAGEAGKRFGVVAAEIRRLADSVMESTGEIEGKVGEIQAAINRLVIASEKGSKGIQEGMDFSSQMAVLLSDMVEAAQSTTEAAKQISLSTQQQRTASGQVVGALKDFETGARQTTSSINQISSIGRRLLEMSKNLKELTDNLKIKAL